MHIYETTKNFLENGLPKYLFATNNFKKAYCNKVFILYRLIKFIILLFNKKKTKYYFSILNCQLQ